MKPNSFVWYELATSDPDAAAEFYGKVVGWRFTPQPAAPEGMTYLIGWAGETPAVGVMSYRPDMPEPNVTRWWGNVYVDDVDAVAAKIEAAGGAIRHQAETNSIERTAAVTDPQGGGFVLFHPEGAGEAPPGLPYMTPGTVGWHELVAADWAPMFDFYAGLFGWTKEHGGMPMPDGGVYQPISLGAEHPTGAMMSAQEGQPKGWVFYFAVADIDVAKAATESAGGTVMMGPMEVPGGMWIVLALDPQGGLFALVGPRTA